MHPTSDESGAPTGVLVPIRAFTAAKSRLAEALGERARARLVRVLAARVLAAAAPLPTWVVTDDAEVAAWAPAHGAQPLAVGRSGLSESVTAAVEVVRADGYERVIVAHADLARVVDLRRVLGPGLVIAPDRHHDGSNVLCLPTAAGFTFSYGPGSYHRHVAEAHRLGLPLTVVDDPTLAWDVDEPADLAGLPADVALELEQVS